MCWKQDIPRKFSSNTGTLPWASIYRQLKIIPKPLMSHNPLRVTPLHSREKKPSSTHQNSNTSLPNQETLASQTSSTPLTGSRLHNKDKPQTSSLQKGHPKHSNLNKMKRQRNIHQVKEHDKCPANHTKEEEIGSLHEKEFRIMRVRNLNATMHFFHHPKVHRRETHLDQTHKMHPVPCSTLKASVFLRPSSRWDSAGEGMLRHTVGIRAETPGSGLTREGLLLFKANFHAGIHTGNNLSADIRATAW